MGFLGAGLVTATGALGGYAARAGAASATTQVWMLDPDAACATGENGCSSCSACRAHAANKLFASAAAADANRAHTYCKCHVKPFAVLEQDVYDALFVTGGARPSADLRRQWVRAVLAQAPPLPELQPELQRQLPLTVLASAKVEAVGRHVFQRRKTNGTRWLYVDVESTGPVTATITIMRHGATLATRTVSGPAGNHRRKVEIPAGIKPGPARLRVALRTGSGDVKMHNRAIVIPKAWPVRH